MTTWVDVLRWFNVALASVAVALLISGTMYRADRLTPRERRARPWVIAVLGVVAYGAAESAVQHVEPGVRVPAMLVALLGLCGAMLYRFGDRDGR